MINIFNKKILSINTNTSNNSISNLSIYSISISIFDINTFNTSNYNINIFINIFNILLLAKHDYE